MTLELVEVVTSDKEKKKKQNQINQTTPILHHPRGDALRTSTHTGHLLHLREECSSFTTLSFLPRISAMTLKISSCYLPLFARYSPTEQL